MIDMLNLILEVCDQRPIGNGITYNNSNDYVDVEANLVFFGIFIVLFFGFIIAVCIISFCRTYEENKRIAIASKNELQVGMTREEVISILAKHSFTGINYSVDSDGTMYFITKEGCYGIVRERVAVEFDENNKVKAWHTMPF